MSLQLQEEELPLEMHGSGHLDLAFKADVSRGIVVSVKSATMESHLGINLIFA